jgi:hypothetical protein
MIKRIGMLAFAIACVSSGGATAQSSDSQSMCGTPTVQTPLAVPSSTSSSDEQQALPNIGDAASCLLDRQASLFRTVRDVALPVATEATARYRKLWACDPVSASIDMLDTYNLDYLNVPSFPEGVKTSYRVGYGMPDPLPLKVALQHDPDRN